MNILENVKVIDIEDRIVALFNERHFVYLKDDFNEKSLSKDLAKVLLEDLVNVMTNL